MNCQPVILSTARSQKLDAPGSQSRTHQHDNPGAAGGRRPIHSQQIFGYVRMESEEGCSSPLIGNLLCGVGRILELRVFKYQLGRLYIILKPCRAAQRLG